MIILQYNIKKVLPDWVLKKIKLYDCHHFFKIIQFSLFFGIIHPVFNRPNTFILKSGENETIWGVFFKSNLADVYKNNYEIFLPIGTFKRNISLINIFFLISKIYVQPRSIKLKKTPFLTVGYTKEDFVYFNSWLHHVLEDTEIFIVFYCLLFWIFVTEPNLLQWGM